MTNNLAAFTLKAVIADVICDYHDCHIFYDGDTELSEPGWFVEIGTIYTYGPFESRKAAAQALAESLA